MRHPREKKMERTFRVRIVRNGQEFEAEGDKKFVLDMLERFESEPQSATAGRSASERRSATPVAAKKSVSVREFIQRLGLKRHTDRVLAFGYYLEKHLGKAEFSPADINNCYYEAKMETSNTSQAIIQNIKAGRMMEAKAKKGARKGYLLTQIGEEFIEKKLKQKPA